MLQQTKDLLWEAQQYCILNDKSTEFMHQYMQDVAHVDLDTVLAYLQAKPEDK